MAKGKAAKKGGGPRAPAARLSPQQLYEQAQLALQFDDFDAARTALRKAVKLDPSNIECMDALGALLAEVGPEEEAVQVLRQAVSLSPDAGYEKYLYLGQLLEAAAEALAATRKGVQVLQAQHAAARAASSPDAGALGRALAGALCSLTEMLMAGAGAGPEAGAAAGAAAASGGGGGVAAVAEEAEGLLALAAGVDPESPEPGQALAALRCGQGRAAEALEALQRSMALWHTPSTRGEGEDGEEGEEAGPEAQRRRRRGGGAAGGSGKADDGDEAMRDAGASSEEEGESDDDDDDDDEEEEEGPSYEFRIECAKLLLELDDTTAAAIDVLEALVEEDDRVPEAWQLLALAYYSGHQYTEAAEVLAKGQALLKAMGAGPQDEITQLFADLQSAIKEALAQAKPEGQAGEAGKAQRS